MTNGAQGSPEVCVADLSVEINIFMEFPWTEEDRTRTPW